MKKILFLSLIALYTASCTKPTNSALVSNAILNCYDKSKFGVLKPEIYDGLPNSCNLVLLNEEFNNNDYNWFTESSTDAKIYITGGVYTASTASKYSYYYLKSKKESYKDLDNFQIESEFLISKISDINNYFGITWGGIDWNFNCIGVKTDGKVVYSKNSVQASKPSIIFTSPVLSQFIQNGFNQLTIRKYKDKTFIFLNKILITQLSNINLIGNDFGFFIPSNSNVDIENITISTWNF